MHVLYMTALNKEHRPLNVSLRDQIEVKAHNLCDVLDFPFGIMKTNAKKLTNIIECALCVVFK